MKNIFFIIEIFPMVTSESDIVFVCVCVQDQSLNLLRNLSDRSRLLQQNPTSLENGIL